MIWVLVLVVMDSQDPFDWELPLSQPLVDPDQPSTSRRRARDETGPSERQVQPRAEAEIQQFSVPVLQLDRKALVIVLESEPALSGSYEMVIEGCLENTSGGSTVTRISSEVGHRLWLQGPLNHLSRERRSNYIAAILLRILEFLSV